MAGQGSAREESTGALSAIRGDAKAAAGGTKTGTAAAQLLTAGRTLEDLEKRRPDSFPMQEKHRWRSIPGGGRDEP
jgi:hypothetical protein